MPTPYITTSVADRVLTIELTRRDKKNAITADMYQAMSEALVRADVDPAIQVVLLRGQPDMFTAGNDVADFLDPTIRARGEAQRFIRTISEVRVPLVGAVGGVAVGVGATMLLHCDLVIAAEGARFQFPFVSLGLCPEAGSSVLLPQLAGHRVAAELLLLGEFIGADRARDAGIINEVVPPEGLIPRAEAVAGRLAAQPRDALLTTKALLRRPPGRLARDVIDEELPEFERLLLSDTARQTFQAFLSRRSPS